MYDIARLNDANELSSGANIVRYPLADAHCRGVRRDTVSRQLGHLQLRGRPRRLPAGDRVWAGSDE